MTIVSLIILGQILAIAVVYVSGVYTPITPVYGLAGLALGTGWLAIVNALLLRLIGEGHYDAKTGE